MFHKQCLGFLGTIMTICIVFNGCSSGAYRGQDGLDSCYYLLSERGSKYYLDVLGITPETLNYLERCVHDYNTAIH